MMDELKNVAFTRKVMSFKIQTRKKKKIEKKMKDKIGKKGR